MRQSPYFAGLVLAAALPAQHTLFFPQAEDATSLNAAAKSLSAIDSYDIAGVTPSTTGSQMFRALPVEAISTLVGDADADGIIAEFYKDNSKRQFTHAGCFLKNADRSKRDRRLFYWTVQELPNASNPQFWVLMKGGTKKHRVRPGDFVRIGENGNADMFITQDLIMKAAGSQSGTIQKGASAICQDAKGNLYYSPPAGGQHWVSNGTKQVLAQEGAIIWIPAAAISYDAAGNVRDVKAGASRLVVETGTNAPSQNPNCVAMVTNSGGLDRDGRGMAQTVSNWVTNLSGLAIDPAGGTFTSRLTGSVAHPNLLFTFDNVYYRGTIFSTQKRLKQLGTLATINGVLMGTRKGKANASWLGCRGAGNSPVVNGLELADWKLAATMPNGIPVLSTKQRGGIDQANDKTFALDFQGLTRLQPVLLTLGFGPQRGRALPAINFGSTFSGFSTLYTFNLGPITGFQGLSDVFGRKFAAVPVPKSAAFKGLALIWQALFFNKTGGAAVSNPIVTEFR